MNIVSVTLFLSISLPALYASGYCNEVTSLSDQLIQQIKQQNATNSLPMPRRTSVLGDGYGGEGYTVFPLLSNKTTSTTAILIHGLGGTGQEWGFLSLALSFFSLNFVKFIIPTAPMRNVTLLKQTLPSWFDVFLAGTQGLQVDRAQLLDSVARIDRIVRGEHDTGVDYDRIFLVGASQGGGVALSTFLRSPFPLGGCISIASWLPLHEEYPDQLSTKINNKHILLIHVSPHLTSLLYLFVFLLSVTNKRDPIMNLCVLFTFHRERRTELYPLHMPRTACTISINLASRSI